MEDELKLLSVKEFRELGFLQEINRQFLHPMGLALSVNVDEDGEECFGGIWDYRDDPDGIHYAEGVISNEKAARIVGEARDRLNARFKALGYWVQPLT